MRYVAQYFWMCHNFMKTKITFKKQFFGGLLCFILFDF